MVNMIGFSRKSPFELANPNVEPGEPDWYMTVNPKPSIEAPLRARVAFPSGCATFDSPDDARKYLEHPGRVPLAARTYLEHFGETPDALPVGGESDGE